MTLQEYISKKEEEVEIVMNVYDTLENGTQDEFEMAREYVKDFLSYSLQGLAEIMEEGKIIK